MTEGPKRNDPCPCGSGKKYKSCCYKNDASKKSKLLSNVKPINQHSSYKVSSLLSGVISRSINQSIAEKVKEAAPEQSDAEIEKK